MKYFAVFALSLLSIPPVFGDVIPITRTVTGNSVNLRVSPSLKSEIVGQLQKGQQVQVILTDGEWSAIVPPPGIEAWVTAAYIKDGVVIGSRVNAQNGPGISYGRLTYLRKGTAVTVLQEEAGWVRIELPETGRLWVDSRYISSSSRAASTTPLEGPGRPRAVIPVGDVSPSRAAPSIREKFITRRRTETPPPPAPVSPSPPPPVRVPASTSPAPDQRAGLTGIARSYTGFIRKLEQPFTSADREYAYELVRSRFDPAVIGYLTGDIIDLKKYQSRQVRLWAVIVEKKSGYPVFMEVRGAGVAG